MKKVKIMLSAILIMAVVAGALAFKVKSNDVCTYDLVKAGGAASETCTIVDNECLDDFRTTSQGAGEEDYARTLTPANCNIPDPCPTTTLCIKSRTLDDE